MQFDHILVADTETTGLADPVGVCEVGIIEVDEESLVEVDRQRSLIDPELPISFTASGIHRITNDMVAHEPNLDEYFNVVLGGRYNGKSICMVAHNASYDFPKIKDYLGVEPVALCTLKLARKVWPDAENHKLATLKFMLNLGRRDGTSHSALDDVEDTADLLRAIISETGLNIQELLELQRKPTVVKVMPFSKHKGEPLEDVPVSFWIWLRKKSLEPDGGVDPDLAYSVNLLHPHIKLKEKENV